MAAKKWNWPALKLEYADSDKSLKEFAALKGIGYPMIRRISSKQKWRKVRKKVEQRKEEKVIEKIANDHASRVMRMRERHIKLGIMLQNKGFAALKDKEKLAADKDAIAAIRAGVAIEQAAMEGTGVAPSDGQVNIFNQQNIVNQGMANEQTAGHVARVLEILDRAGQLKKGPVGGDNTEDD